MCVSAKAATPLADGPQIVSVRAWLPPSAAHDTLASAEAALQSAPESPTPFEFRLDSRQANWYALDVVAGDKPALLELTHPSVRLARLYLPGVPEAAAVSGRDVPVDLRQEHFPASFELPAGVRPTRVYLRVWSAVPIRGRFLLQAADSALASARLQWLVMALCFAGMALAAVYSLARAARVRSTAWTLYGVMSLSTLVTAIFVLGFGEAWLWRALSAWRGQSAVLSACLTSGVLLLLCERVFALEVRTPRYALLLRVVGLACAIAGLAGLAGPLSLHQSIALACASVATVLTLTSLRLAWHTHNRPAAWLLAGFLIMLVGIWATAAALLGAIAFQPWVLLAMPLGGVLKLPFNLYGLSLQERRELQVRQSLAEALLGVAEGESRQALGSRLARASERTGSLLMLVRIDCLAPGSATLRRLDAVAVERFLHMLIKAAVRPGIVIGRWSHHELALRGSLLLGSAALDALFTQLFVRAHHLTRLGVEPREARLRIAFARVPPGHSPEVALGQLENLLDDQRHGGRARLEWDYTQSCPVPVAPV